MKVLECLDHQKCEYSAWNRAMACLIGEEPGIGLREQGQGSFEGQASGGEPMGSFRADRYIRVEYYDDESDGGLESILFSLYCRNLDHNGEAGFRRVVEGERRWGGSDWRQLEQVLSSPDQQPGTRGKAWAEAVGVARKGEVGES